MSDRHTARAKRLFGEKAFAVKRPAKRFDDTRANGRLRGACAVCLSHECRRKNDHTIAVETAGLAIVKGRGHTWKDAWARAEREAKRGGQ